MIKRRFNESFITIKLFSGQFWTRIKKTDWVHHLDRCQHKQQLFPRTKLQYGPLFDGAIVGRKMLPSLVRATVRNAFRAIQHTQNRENHYDVRG